VVDASDDESFIDTTAALPHETFYFKDGNVEVLCENTRGLTTLLRMICIPEYTILPLIDNFPVLRPQFADSLNGIGRWISTLSLPSFELGRNMRCRAPDPDCSESSVTRTRRPSRESYLPNHLGRKSSVARPFTRMRSSTSSSSRNSHPHYQRHTT
jgi:hypothetical protein